MPHALAPLRVLVSVMALLAGLATVARAQIIEVPPFLVVRQDGEFIYSLRIAAGADSSLQFMWASHPNGNPQRRAYTRHFTSAGVAAGERLRLDAEGEVSFPSLAADGRGGFLAGWSRDAGPEVFDLRLLDGSGAPTTSVFTPMTGSNSAFAFFAPAGLPTGSVIARAGAGAIHAQTFDTAGQASGSVMLVRDHDLSGAVPTFVAPTASGGFVIAWQEDPGIWGRVYDATGSPLGDATMLADDFSLDGLAASPLGGFVVVGARDSDTHARPSGVWFRRFDASGAPLGPPTLADAVDPDVFARPTVDYDPTGRFLVAWALASGGGIQTPQARAFDAAGVPVGPQFEIIEEQVGEIVMTARPDGRFALGWRSDFFDHDGEVVALCVPPQWTGCGDGVVEPPCERCDQGPANSDSTPNACRTGCYFPSCGDGVLDFNEDCDDGNTLGCDGCDTHCHLEEGWICGDGVLSTDCDEQCDDGPGNDDSTPDACRTSCRLASCGDGVLDDGEGCDDGNLTSCDGCSDACVPEPGLTCGDGIPELLCGEECDDGNGVDGDGCTEPCKLERIPGGGSPRSDCLVEWSIDNPTNVPLHDKHGAINGTQTCVDGDSGCDFDAVPGQCTFHLRVCANNTDVDECSPGPRLAAWELRTPSASKAAKHPALAAVRAAFATVPGAIVGPDLSNVCSGTLDVTLPLKAFGVGFKPAKLTLKSQATLYTGEKDGDKLKLICVP